MDKPISTRVHGMIDYAWSAVASALSTRVDGATSTARLLRSAAAAATATSAVTKYERGALHLLPMKAHLGVDFLICTTLVASPLFLPASERRYAVAPVLLGAVGLVTGLLTETRSPLEIDEEFGVFTAGEVSGSTEPETDVEPAHLRVYLE
jgi:hypothetical protein